MNVQPIEIDCCEGTMSNKLDSRSPTPESASADIVLSQQSISIGCGTSPRLMPTGNRILSRLPEESSSFHFTEDERQTLFELAQSRKAADRERCAAWFRVGSSEPSNVSILLNLADLLIPDRIVRWAILCDLTDFTETHPEKLWPLIVKWGSVYNRDIRAGIACCLLEHILQFHFGEYFERSKQLILSGNKRFAPTLSMCNKLGQTEEPENARRFDEFAASLHLRPWKSTKVGPLARSVVAHLLRIDRQHIRVGG